MNAVPVGVARVIKESVLFTSAGNVVSRLSRAAQASRVGTLAASLALCWLATGRGERREAIGAVLFTTAAVHVGLSARHHHASDVIWLILPGIAIGIAAIVGISGAGLSGRSRGRR